MEDIADCPLCFYVKNQLIVGRLTEAEKKSSWVVIIQVPQPTSKSVGESDKVVIN